MRKQWLDFVRRRKYFQQPTRKLLSERIDRVFNRKFVLIESVASILEPIKHPYVIVGGHAVVFHGHPRTTQDIDVITSPGNVQKIINDLNADVQGVLGCNIPSLSGYTTLVNGVEVDIMELDQPWVDLMLDSAIRTKYGNMVSAEFLVMLKTIGRRGVQDDTDVMKVIKRMDSKRIKYLRKLMSKYLPNELEDFDSMVEIAATVDI